MEDYTASIPVESPDDEEHREVSPHSLPPFLRIFFIIGMLFLLIVMIVKIPPYFSSPPKNLIIKGLDVLDDKTITKYLEIGKDESWLRLEPYVLSLRLKRHPWIEKAIVHRSFPLTITATIVERTPIGYLRTADDLVLLGNDYMVIKNTPSNRNWDLPIIVNRRLNKLEDGDIVQKSQLIKAFQLIDILKDHPVLDVNSISEVIVTDPYNIEVITIPHGIRVKFGFDNFEKKLVTLHQIMPELIDIKGNIRYIDLRYTRGIVVKKKR